MNKSTKIRRIALLLATCLIVVSHDAFAARAKYSNSPQCTPSTSWKLVSWYPGSYLHNPAIYWKLTCGSSKTKTCNVFSTNQNFSTGGGCLGGTYQSLISAKVTYQTSSQSPSITTESFNQYYCHAIQQGGTRLLSRLQNACNQTQ